MLKIKPKRIRSFRNIKKSHLEKNFRLSFILSQIMEFNVPSFGRNKNIQAGTSRSQFFFLDSAADRRSGRLVVSFRSSPDAGREKKKARLWFTPCPTSEAASFARLVARLFSSPFGYRLTRFADR